MSLKTLFAKALKVAKSKEGRAAIAVASVVLPAVAPKAVAKAAKVYRKVKVVKGLVE